jgi:hypothetical protein
MSARRTKFALHTMRSCATGLSLIASPTGRTQMLDDVKRRLAWCAATSIFAGSKSGIDY